MRFACQPRWIVTLSLYLGLGLSPLAVQAQPINEVVDKIVLQRLNQRVWVPLNAAAQSPAAEQRYMRQLLLQVSHQSEAELAMQLCDAQRQNCQPVGTDGRLFSDAFAQQRLNERLWLGIVAHHWRGIYPPVFVRAELIIWPGEN